MRVSYFAFASLRSKAVTTKHERRISHIIVICSELSQFHNGSKELFFETRYNQDDRRSFTPPYWTEVGGSTSVNNSELTV